MTLESGNFDAGLKLAQVPSWMAAGSWTPEGAFWSLIVTVSTRLGSWPSVVVPDWPPLAAVMATSEIAPRPPEPPPMEGLSLPELQAPSATARATRAETMPAIRNRICLHSRIPALGQPPDTVLQHRGFLRTRLR